VKIPISDHSLDLEHGATLYVCDSGCDDGDIRISVVVCGCSLNVDMSIVDLMRFRRLLADAYREAFDVQPELKCPACGYDRDTADLAGDHQTCRLFPFFPGEKGKSHAKDY